MTPMVVYRLGCVALACGLVACGSSGPVGGGGEGAGAGSTGAAGSTANGTGGATSTGAGGNGQPPGDCDDPDELCLPLPESGFQIMSVGDTINPGQDVEYCEVVQLPGDASQTYYVNRFEVAMTKFSHHLIVAAAVPGSATEANMTVGDKQNCITPDVFGGDLLPVTGSQHPYNENEFPEGVGRIYHGGQKLVFDYHYLNSSSEPIAARGAVNFHTVEASEVTRVAQSFGFYNLGISIPPASEQGFTKSCTFTQDLMVHQITRHTHQWGTDFDVWFEGGPSDGEHIWTSPNYEETEHAFGEPILMPAGTGFKFRCEFKNTTSSTLKFGTKASDEMCILFGTWFTVGEGDPITDQGCFN